MRKGRQRFTVMVVPHTENRIFNFQISFFSLIFFTFTIGILVAGFVLLALRFRPMNDRLADLSGSLHDKEMAVENLRDQISALRKAEKGFQAGLQNVRLAMTDRNNLAPPASTVVASFVAGPETPGARTLRELAELKNVTGLMESSADTMDSIGKELLTYRSFLSDTPTMWPLKGVHGVITTRFGWTIHPFTHLGYLHLGVDIAWASGTPIEAAANGIVIQTGYTEDLGNFVSIQHKYGFMTRYLHMMKIVARKGQRVSRGDVIGYVGSTGLSTGPHVHYEVHLGGNYLDPMNFLSIPRDLDMGAGGNRGFASD